MNKSYVYIYLDPRRPGKWETDSVCFLYEPFYVGEGVSKRILDHLSFSDKDCSIKTRKIRKIRKLGLEPYYFKIKENLSGDDAILVESSIILQLGTIAKIPNVKSGPLSNLCVTIGPKKEVSDETRIKIGNGNRHKAVSQDTRQRISKTLKNSICKEWVINFENGSSVLIKNLKQWCIENGINHSSLRNTLSYGHYYRGMRLLKPNAAPTQREETCKSKKKIIIFLDDRSPVTVTNLHKWCHENSIVYSSLINTSRFKTYYKGMRVFKQDELF